MRNMLQLLGGVAVAGVVAAGSAAFTAPGGLANGVTGQKSFLGGTVSHSIVGASLSALDFTSVDATTPGSTKVTAFKLTFNADTPATSVVTISNLVGTGANGGSGLVPTNFFCTDVNVTHESTCTAGTAAATYNGHFTGVGGFDIKVVAA
jgi:hypothetical protein